CASVVAPSPACSSLCVIFFFSSRRRHTRSKRDWSSDVCSSDLGGGPGGYEAAQAGAKYGADITVVEDQGMGGASILLDCVPSKSFIAGGNIKTDLRRADDMGLNEGIVKTELALQALNERVTALATRQSDDVRARTEELGVRIIDGRGYFDKDQTPAISGGHKVSVTHNDDGRVEVLDADLVLIATGATPRV